MKSLRGRVPDFASTTLKSLARGFYFDNDSLPNVAKPMRIVGYQWRFVVVRRSVVAGSTYDASTRSVVASQPQNDVWAFAETVANALPVPADA